jgi:pilus assembly protein FimV
VFSGVGEPLRAEIDVVDVGANEARALSVRLATTEEFWRAGIEPPTFLGALGAAITRGTKGRTVVTLTSSQPIEEPFMSLLVQLGSPSRQSTREYPVLLEERRTREARPAPILPELAPAQPEPAPSEPALVPAGPTALAANNGEHRVRPGETLATIASALKVPGATLEQALVAFVRANPGAFGDGNMNQLSAGQVLMVPDEVAVRAVSPDEARRMVAEHRAAAQRALAAADRLQLSRQDAGTAGADDGAAARRASSEAQERLAMLERSIESLHKLAELQNRQISRLQQVAIGNAVSPGPGAAGASEPGSVAPPAEDRYLQRALGRLVGEHWPWFATALVLAFAAWVWMPLKTARLWRKKRRRKERMLRRILRGEDRARRKRRQRVVTLAPA